MLAAAALDTMEEANFIFHKYDQNKDGQIDEDELALCLQGLQVRINGRQRKTEEEVRDWVRKELKRNDTDGDGQLSFDEFVEYYNSYISQNRRSFEDTYKVTAHLGKGAFATVKKASVRSPAEGEPSEVAVKRIQKAGVNMKLMHNEVSIWGMLDHPHLVRLLDAFETPDELILVQELMEGGDLFEQLRKLDRFAESSAQRLAAQIISAVAYLHSNGVVHCDLKPSNILVLHAPPPAGGEGAASSAGDAGPAPLSVKLADFGLSQTLQRADPEIKKKRRGSRSNTNSPLKPADAGAEPRTPPTPTAAGIPASTSFDDPRFGAAGAGEGRRAAEEGPPILTDVCGTPEYFAPELVRLHQGESVADGGYNAKVDCWCCGCIVYELLAGAPPFSAKSEDVLFYKILENQIEFPKQFFDSLSDQVKPLILGLTATDPAERLGAAEAMQREWLATGLALSAPKPDADDAMLSPEGVPLRPSKACEDRALDDIFAD